MANQKGSKQNNWPKSTYMFPSLHGTVENEVRDDMGAIRFHDQNTDRNSNNSYQTHIVARFVCINGKCSAPTWGSGTVAILIRGYPGNAYNAVVFNQRCKTCNALGKMNPDRDSYASRVSYRLKRWAGIRMEPPPYSTRGTPQHRREFCEGCRAGYCLEGRV